MRDRNIACHTKFKKYGSLNKRNFNVSPRDSDSEEPENKKMKELLRYIIESSSDSKTIIDNNPIIHDLCTIRRNVRKLWNKDNNCFYWSMIIALNRFKDQYSYDQIETLRPSYTLDEILRLRIEIFNWWNEHLSNSHSQNHSKVYAVDRNYMVTFDNYFILETMPTCMNIAENNDANAPYVDFIIDTLNLQNLLASRIYLLHRVRTLITITLPTELFSNNNQFEFSVRVQAYKYYQGIIRWHILWHSIPKKENSAERPIEQVEDDMLKGIIAHFIYSEIKARFDELPIRTLDNEGIEFCFYEKEFHSILDMNAGTSNDEFIAIAAIHNIVIFYFSYTETELEYPYQQLIYLNTPKCITAFGMSPDDPFETRMVEWGEARPYLVDNKAIAISRIIRGGMMQHVSPVCPIDMPHYVTHEQLDDIEKGGHYFLRSLCNAENHGKDVPAFLYALMLACAPMPSGFRYCCTILHKSYVQKWTEQITSLYVQWWKTETSILKIKSIIKNDTMSVLPSFVYTSHFPKNKDNDIVIDKYETIYINGNKLNEFTMSELCQTWVNAVVLADVLGKTIFVVRGAKDITAYSASELRHAATWDEVMPSVRKGEGVCCFTHQAAEDANKVNEEDESKEETKIKQEDKFKNENEFNVTHVLLPASPVPTSASSGAASSYTGSKSTSQSACTCACVRSLKLLTCTTPRVLTLQEADALMQTVTN